MNFIKNILKAVVAISVALTSATAFAGSVNENAGNFPTFMTTDKSLSNSTWQSSTTISPGELLSFRMHYYLQEGDSTSNMRFSMENLNNRTFSAGETESVSGTVSASGLSSSSGSVSVTFTNDVKLNLYNVSWQKVGCTSVGCESPLVDSASKVLTSSGMSIGSVEGYTNGNWQGKHYAGDVVVSFRVESNGNPNPGDDIEVTTNSATNVDEDSARLNGRLDEGDNARVWFALSRNSNPSCSNASEEILVSGTKDEGAAFSSTVNNLSDDTKYYFRACAENSAGDAVGSIKSFTTDDEGGGNNDDIEVTTNSATSVNDDNARLNGEVEEGDNVEVWFALSRDSNPSCSSSSDREDVSGGDRDEGDDFSLRVDNLREDTRYYFRACGENNDGDDAGSIRSFTTDDDNNGGSDDIEVVTNSATNIEDSSARLRGELEDGDDAEVWFAIASEFASSPSCSNSSQREDVDGNYDSGDDFFVTVSGLRDDTRYFYRACAEDDNGDDSGEIRSFETDGSGGDDGEVTTLAPSSVSDDTARLNGRLEEGDDLEVWFALSRTDSTPSCSNSSQKEEVSGRFDDGDTFSRVVTNLRDNSTYFYRACAEDEDGEDIFGSVRTFVTGNGGNPSNLQSALTGSATGVGTVSARVNGIVSGSGSGECYFNFGTSTNVPLKTADVSVNDSATCTSFLSGLRPNTTYYYQTVLERNGVVRKGAIRSFRTSSNLPPIVINNPPVDPNPGTTIIRVVDRVNQNEEDLGVTKWVSGEFDDDFVTAIDARRGEVVFYRVLVRNNTDETLEDIVVTDRIPFELELANNNDIDDDSDKQLVWDIRQLRPGESKIFITEMSVREDTPVGLEIISFASAEAGDFETDSNNVLIEVTGGSIVDEDNNQGASIFGAGFFPDSLLGWLILIAIMIAIAYLISRLLFSRKESYKLNAELAAMEAERMRSLR